MKMTGGKKKREGFCEAKVSEILGQSEGKEKVVIEKRIEPH